MKEKKNTKNVNQKKGISLIVLVITIIVIVILAVAVILSMANNNPISNANKASFQNDMKSMQEELELTKASNYANSNGQSYGTINFGKLSGSDKYTDKFIVKDGSLKYVNNKLSDEEKEWCKELGVEDSEYTLLETNESLGVTIKNNELKTSWGVSGFGPGYAGITFPGSIVVPEGVTTIDEDAFCAAQLFEVILPESLTTIKARAFYLCGLSSIEIPNKVTKIEYGVFRGCRCLKYVKLSESIESIGENAFADCDALKSIEIPDSIKTIGENAFWIEMGAPEIVVTMSQKAFDSCFPGKNRDEAASYIQAKEIIIK